MQKNLVSSLDLRTNILNELLTGLRTIKYFSWEKHWIDRTLEARNTELHYLYRKNVASLAIYILWISVPIAASAISFGVHIGFFGKQLDIGSAFIAIQLFSMVREPLHIIPRMVLQLMEAKLAIDRIQAYIEKEEYNKFPLSDDTIVLEKPAGFGFHNASFMWAQSSESKRGNYITTLSEGNGKNSYKTQDFSLTNISIVFPEDSITLIIGPTGSGKSSLLMALLGEMILNSGQILSPRDHLTYNEGGFTSSISYAAQIPWLQHQSIRENILFGSQFEKERYESVIVSCALGPDLALLENGDETKIGSNGINLSGGQKARVALARAVYAKSKYVLLDDPLSAVDSTTAHLLVNKLFSGPLLRHRTVLLVTHHVAQALPCAQYIVKMDSGQIKLQGYVQDLKASGELSSLIPEDHVTGEPIQRNEYSPLQDLESESKSLDGRRLYERRTASDESSKEEIYDATLRWSSFVTYLRASSMKTWFGLGILAIIFQILKLIERYWLKTWMEIEGNHQWFKNSKAIVSDKRIDSMLISVSGHPLFSVGIHVLLGSCAVFITLLFGLIECHAASVASKNLFQRLLLAVSHSTLRWIDETPGGRILNRFTRDIGTIDTTLSTSLQTIIMSLITFVSSLITLAFAFPPFLIPSICLGILYYKLADMYVRTARNLRQMESKSYSPIFSGFGELMDGIVTVRAFSAEDRFRDLMFQKIDASSNLWYQYWMTGRWLQIRFDFLSGLAVLITNILAITATLPGSAGWAALCINSASSLTNNIYWACRSWTQLELDLNSVERIAQYFNCPQEEHINEEKSCPPQKWPELSGPNKDALIVAKNLEISYAPDLPAVLHDVSFTFRTQERIAIVGRTGSGKSTLTTALLRLINPSKGSITIDGIDINKVPLRDLRSRITIIPQDTILFSGTIKQNLDPFDEYNESECLGALTRVHLRPSSLDETAVVSKTQIRSDDMNNAPKDNKQQILHLNSPVNPGGSNFSTGQRQLIALARALLRRSTIIIFDEATSSLDFETDSIVQKVIREETKGSLLLTVAHRLHTVIDYDKILVLDEGRVIEFDTPFNLWNLEGGVFKEMCMGNGSFTFAKDPVEEKIRVIE